MIDREAARNAPPAVAVADGHADTALEVLLPHGRRGLRRDPLLRRMLAVADLLTVLCVAGCVAALARAPDLFVWSLATTPIWLLLAKLHGLYDRDHRSLRHLTVDELPTIVVWTLSSTAATTLVVRATPAESLGLDLALVAWGVAAGTGFVLRAAARLLWRHTTSPERTVVLGEGRFAERTRRKLALFADIHVELLDQRAGPAEPLADPPWLEGVDRLVVAAGATDEALIADLAALCRRRKIKLSVVPPAHGVLATAAHLSRVADIPLVEYTTWDISRSTLVLKRAVDLGLAVPLTILLVPVFAVVAIAIRLDSPGRAVFVQRRAGLGGREFRMLKFRTMVDRADERLSEVVSLDDLEEPMFKLERDPRVTRIGRFLRRTSLDELPQLINVVKGEMSLVGPRPEQVELVERYRPEHRFRLAVKPGLTGPMQVFGRGELTFEERLAVERDYVENLSLRRDLQILAMTIAAVAGRKGAY